MKSDETPVAPDAPASEKKTWKVGTLTYDKKGLARLFFWLSIGQFSFFLEYRAVHILVGLHFANLGLAGEQMGVINGLFGLGALIMVPILGTWSDRFRSRLGRRRPFDLATTPIWFIGLLIMPFTETFGGALFAMILIGFAGAGSNILNAFYNDVVPSELLGRFIGVKSIIGTFADLCLFLLIMPYYDDYAVVVWIALAVFGFTGEMLMLWKVKEGDYPDPGPAPGVVDTVKSFLKNGLGSTYIVAVWLSIGMTAFGGPVMNFYLNVYLKTDLEMSSQQLGWVQGAGSVVSLLILLPAGWVFDRFGPRRPWMIAATLVGLCQVGMFLFGKTAMSATAWFVSYKFFDVFLAAALLPIMYAYIPKDQFGQICGANQLVTRSLQVIGSYIIGMGITLMNEDYTYAFLFGGICYLLVPVFLFATRFFKYPYGDSKPSMNPYGRSGRSS